MSDRSRQFPHIPLRRTKTDSARSGRPPRRSPNSTTNLGDRSGHGSKLQSSASSIVVDWQAVLEKRRKEGLPEIPNVPSLLLKVDPKSFDADALKSFDIEVVLELEDGYILGAAADSELTKLQEKIGKFIAEQYGGGKVCEIWEILEGNLNNRLEYILSPDLLANWDRVLDDHPYTVDVSIACVGLNSKFSQYPSKKEDEDPEKYGKRVARWSDKRQQTQQEWDRLQLERESDFEDFVKKLGGKFLLIGDYDDRSHLALLPDSFSSRIEISGRGLKDLVVNYAYIFEVSEPESITDRLSNRNESVQNIDAFTLQPPAKKAPRVCVIDSGIQESHRLLRVAIDSDRSTSWVPGQIDIKSDNVKDGGHGTRVAGAILYPQGIPRIGTDTAICWLQNARVLGDNCQVPDRLYLPEILGDIVDFYHREPKTRIFNHSINSTAPCRQIYMSAWATAIDNLSWKNDILFVVSAGNLPTVRQQGLSITRRTLAEYFEKGIEYPNFLLEDASRIANPAQSLQALTVGSIAHCTYDRDDLVSIAKQDRPSAFTTTGYGIWDSTHPDRITLKTETRQTIEHP
jgi:hypothetical protein